MKWSHGPLIFDAGTYPFPEACPYLARALDAYGRERMMWGSDFSAIRYVRQAVGSGPEFTCALLYARQSRPVGKRPAMGAGPHRAQGAELGTGGLRGRAR